MAALLKLGGGEVIFTLAAIMILLVESLFPGFFRRAARVVAEEMIGQKAGDARPSHPVLMALTLILGVASLILVVYEFSK